MPGFMPRFPLTAQMQQPLPDGLPDLDPETLRKLSEAAAAIATHAPPTPDEQASVDGYMAQQDATFNASPEHQAAQAIRAAVARGQTGLTSPDFNALPTSARGRVTHTLGAMGNAVAEGPSHPHLTNSDISSTIANGGNSVGAIDDSPIGPADIGDKLAYYTGREAAENQPLPEQDTELADRNIGRAGLTHTLDGKGWDGTEVMKQRMSQPSAFLGGISQQQAAQMRAKDLADYNARETAKSNDRQKLITQRGQQEAMMRQLRQNGPEWLLTQPNQGYNPAAAAMFPELGAAQIAGGNLANNTTLAGAARTNSEANMREASAKEKEFAYATSDETAYRHYLDSAAHGGQQPMSFQDWRATQTPAAMNGGASATDQTSARIQPGMPVEHVVDTLVSTNPSPDQIKQYGRSLAGKVSVSDLLKYRDQIQPSIGSFGHVLGGAPDPMVARRVSVINQLLSQMMGSVPPRPATPWRFINPLYGAEQIGEWLGGPTPNTPSQHPKNSRPIAFGG